MAEWRDGDEESVSLFPFLDVIACLIGVLTPPISPLALAQMGSKEDICQVEP